MIEFAAGLMLGSSVGAVIMGALIAQTKSSLPVAPSASVAADQPALPTPRRARLTRVRKPGLYVAARATSNARARQLLH